MWFFSKTSPNWSYQKNLGDPEVFIKFTPPIYGRSIEKKIFLGPKWPKMHFFDPNPFFSFIFNNFVTIMMGHQKGKHSWKKVILTMGSWFWREFFPIFWVRITEKRLFSCFAETWKLAENPFFTINYPKTANACWLFGKRVLFSLDNIAQSWPEHG